MITVLDNGIVKEHGTYNQLMSAEVDFASLINAHMIQENRSSIPEKSILRSPTVSQIEKLDAQKGKKHKPTEFSQKFQVTKLLL
jgi:hypothetical protein